ncbi:hypothetical protein HK413_06030 [Mucilaginibacter sp. S1162]|uniref:Uncharacterized protein n=1 Tax=Mucilaginibacter humi TaxID=2732510 RepID=A0ABX1W663_9SPHI|nr:hypothetical protein [Mucilaginibacter humi]NNU33810.1 hypothetical protein [Mucilaginibacter humi]
MQQHFTKFTAQQLKFILINYPAELANYLSTQGDRQYQFWERRPYTATMYSRAVLEEKLDSIHNNPVKATLTELPEDYKFSSASYYLTNKPNDILTYYMEHI